MNRMHTVAHPFANPDVAPFALDTWPLCERHERAGHLTFHDTLEVSRWAQRAQLELELEIDRRFDQLHDRIIGEAWAGVE